MKILTMKMIILQVETHPMMKVEVRMMKTMALTLRTVFSCSYSKPSITLHVITDALPFRTTQKSKFASQIPLMDPSLGSCVLKARNDEWVWARPDVSSTVLLWTRDIARPKGIATEKRFPL
jgi:hypothetical protein